MRRRVRDGMGMGREGLIKGEVREEKEKKGKEREGKGGIPVRIVMISE